MTPETKTTTPVVKKEVAKKTTTKEVEKKEISNLDTKLFYVNNKLSEINFSPSGYNDYAKYDYLTISDTFWKITEVCKEFKLGFGFKNFSPFLSQLASDWNSKPLGSVLKKVGSDAVSTGKLTMSIIDLETGEARDETTTLTVLAKGDKSPQVLLTGLKKMLVNTVFYGVIQGLKEEESSSSEFPDKTSYQKEKQDNKKEAPKPNIPQKVTLDKPTEVKQNSEVTSIFGQPKTESVF